MRLCMNCHASLNAKVERTGAPTFCSTSCERQWRKLSHEEQRDAYYQTVRKEKENERTS